MHNNLPVYGFLVILTVFIGYKIYNDINERRKIEEEQAEKLEREKTLEQKRITYVQMLTGILSLDLNELRGFNLTGLQFNKLVAGKLKFIKFTNQNENHNGFQFKTGLNVDTVPFTNYSECQAGGIYFIEKKYMISWAGSHTWQRTVTIPDDAQVRIEDSKIKADKIILSEREPIYVQLSDDKN